MNVSGSMCPRACLQASLRVGRGSSRAAAPGEATRDVAARPEPRPTGTQVFEQVLEKSLDRPGLGGRARNPLRAAASYIHDRWRRLRRAGDCAPYLPTVVYPKLGLGSSDRAESSLVYGAGTRRSTRAFVLVIVLVVVLLSSMLAVSLLFAMRADVTAHTAGVQQEQAWAAAMSGVARALAVAQASAQGLAAWRDASGLFQDQLVVQDGDDQWRFTVYTLSDSFGAEVRFGLTDESGKLHLDHAPAEWLAQWPDLTVQESSLDPGAPEDADLRADPDAGSGLPSVSATAAGTAASLEEWFARAGVNPRSLYGEDANFNLRLDPAEDDGEVQWPPDDGNGQLDAGLQRYVTLSSYDLNVGSEGRPRVNLNDPDADLTQAGLPQATREYLEALRRTDKNRRLTHVAELLEAQADLKNPAGKVVRLRSGIGKDELPALLDRCTATDALELPGLLNLNTAPAAVLAAVPEIGESLAETIVAARYGLSAAESQTPAWLYQRGLVSADQFKQLAPYLTTRSRQFSFHCVGYAIPSGRYRVLTAIIDVAARPARILALRDLTRFGFPIPLQILQGGEAGVGAQAAVPVGTGY